VEIYQIALVLCGIRATWVTGKRLFRAGIPETGNGGKLEVGQEVTVSLRGTGIRHVESTCFK
jgi:hypothetical protein